jgi:hypothetical protein
VQARGVISLCANPTATPRQHRQAHRVWIEIGRALAEALGIPLQVDWIVARVCAGLVDCDMLLDAPTRRRNEHPSSYRTPTRRAV